MPENQSQPRAEGYDNPHGEPKLSSQPDKPAPARPSDTEAAHAPEEGSSGANGTDPGTAGADFADRLAPDGVRTETDSKWGENPH
jgi:hypothetical protein